MSPAAEVELRDYDVMPGHVDEWVRAWITDIAPLRRQCGFKIVGAWLDRTGSRFVWVLTYEGDDTFDAAEQRYHTLPAREALRPEPSKWIAAARITRVAAVA
jgi:hypothetical protein